jgi:protein TonB
MYADRAHRGRISPTGLALAVGINAALLGALIWSSPEIVTAIDWKPITATNIPVPPPPPPDPAPTKPTEVPRTTEIYAQPPIIDLPRLPDAGPIAVIDPPSIPDVTAGLGGGNGTVVVDPPKPPPVMAGAEVDPRYADALQPDYPADMRRMATEGQVVVRVLIGTDGRVKQIELVRSPSESFFNVTRRQALSRWRFKPATRDGVAYESWKTMSLRFTLVE